MKYLRAISTVILGMLLAVPAAAEFKCSTKAVAGHWIFATALGNQSLGAPFPADKQISALGSMNIDRHGNVTGTFDAVVEGLVDFPAPLEGVPYTGSITINGDCRGRLEFVTAAGSARVDAIAVVSRGEMLAMSLDPNNQWTYQVRRISPVRKYWRH